MKGESYLCDQPRYWTSPQELPMKEKKIKTKRDKSHNFTELLKCYYIRGNHTQDFFQRAGRTSTLQI